MTLISSRNNAKIKGVRALRRRKARQEAGLFLVEGIHHIGEAVESGAPLEAIYYAPDLLDSRFAWGLIETQVQVGTPCFPTTPEVFSSITGKEHPQGILAVARQPNWKLDQMSPENFPRGVALLSPQDPGNLGTVLRSIDAVGGSGLLLLDNSVDPYHPSAVRASMGTIFWHPVLQASLDDFAGWVARHRYHVYGTSARGEVDYRDIPEYLTPRILLMGSEREGLTDEAARLCEQVIRLPMQGRSSSLNLGVAAGVMLYAMLA